MAAEKKVRFGLKKVHYALLETDGTYGTPKPWTGAVALTLTPEGDSSAFYADDGPYAQFVVNGGYTGSLEMAVLEPQIAADLLGEAKDAIGGVYDFVSGIAGKIASRCCSRSAATSTRSDTSCTAAR